MLIAWEEITGSQQWASLSPAEKRQVYNGYLKDLSKEEAWKALVPDQKKQFIEGMQKDAGYNLPMSEKPALEKYIKEPYKGLLDIFKSKDKKDQKDAKTTREMFGAQEDPMSMIDYDAIEIQGAGLDPAGFLGFHNTHQPKVKSPEENQDQWVQIATGERKLITPEGEITEPEWSGEPLTPDQQLRQFQDRRQMRIGPPTKSIDDKPKEGYQGRGIVKLLAPVLPRADLPKDFFQRLVGNRPPSAREQAETMLKIEAQNKGYTLSEYKKLLSPENARVQWLSDRMEDVSRSFVRGGIGSIQGMVSFVGALEDSPLARDLSAAMTMEMDKLSPEEENFATDLAGAMGSSAPFFLPGLGMVKAAQAMKVAPWIMRWGASGIHSSLEAMTEAGMVYDRVLQKTGGDKKAAMEAATKTFWGNVAFLMVSNRLGLYGEHSRLSRKMGLEAVLNADEEAWQGWLSNTVAGDPTRLRDVMYEALLGALVAGPMVMIEQHAEKKGVPGYDVDLNVEAVLSEDNPPFKPGKPRTHPVVSKPIPAENKILVDHYTNASDEIEASGGELDPEKAGEGKAGKEKHREQNASCPRFKRDL